MDLFRPNEDANLLGAVTQVRLKSSFIYLANAVNDLRGHWSVLALTLAPLVLAASLCLLPDALNLQHRLAVSFDGGQSVSYIPAQAPYMPRRLAADTPDLYSAWFTTALHVVFAVLTVLVTLLTLCALHRSRAGTQAAGTFGETVEIYRRAIRLAPSFIWITFQQLLAPVAGLFLYQTVATYLPNSLNIGVYIGLVTVMIVGALIYLWLYFAQFALVFDGQKSWHALLHSRDLMRKRFFRVATRIIVFLAVWSGFNSWAAGAFVIMSRLFGPVGVVTGFVGSTIFLFDFAGISVSYATTAFFVAAGLRLYQDLNATAVPSAAQSAAAVAASQPTGSLPPAVS